MQGYLQKYGLAILVLILLMQKVLKQSFFCSFFFVYFYIVSFLFITYVFFLFFIFSFLSPSSFPLPLVANLVGNGENVVPWLTYQDVAQYIALSVNNAKAVNKEFFLGSENLSYNQVLEIVEEGTLFLSFFT